MKEVARCEERASREIIKRKTEEGKRKNRKTVDVRCEMEDEIKER